jgi:hypothetical protein
VLEETAILEVAERLLLGLMVLLWQAEQGEHMGLEVEAEPQQVLQLALWAVMELMVSSLSQSILAGKLCFHL